MQLSRFPRVRLAHLPTPLEPLARLSAHLGGPTIYVKRDDCTGLAFGGNKTRKLEFTLADAVEKGADVIVTTGGLQSNHARQTAAAFLHDVVEDCGVPLEELARRFGADVAQLVDACTDLLPGDTPDSKSPWIERKRGWLGSLREGPADALLVIGCDKLDNLRSLVADLSAEGPPVFERFRATPEQSLWYYRETTALLAETSHARVHAELEVLCERLSGWVPET